jgi:Mg-chelatase subunit ChlD
MTGPKLAAAAEAASAFVGLLDLRRDRAGVIAFDREAHIVAGLTSDRGLLDSALAGLAPGVGTRIDLGLREGLTLVAGPAARDTADPLIVLLTDGRPDAGSEGELAAIASLARDLGVSLFVIGLGADVDRLLLEVVAGTPDRVYLAPTERDLRAIYAEVAREIPCR